ncbi:MAG: hypothetical protein NC133_04380, partial [Prevotella sp.]|nr:hypothetical protein [Prevotella sp.]
IYLNTQTRDIYQFDGEQWVYRSSLNGSFYYENVWHTETLFSNMGGNDSYVKIAQTNQSRYPFIVKLQAQRVNSSCEIQIVSGSIYMGQKHFVLEHLAGAVYANGSALLGMEKSYLFVDSEGTVWAHIASYTKAVIEFTTDKLHIDGTTLPTAPEDSSKWMVNGNVIKN